MIHFNWIIMGLVTLICVAIVHYIKNVPAFRGSTEFSSILQACGIFTGLFTVIGLSTAVFGFSLENWVNFTFGNKASLHDWYWLKLTGQLFYALLIIIPFCVCAETLGKKLAQARKHK